MALGKIHIHAELFPVAFRSQAQHAQQAGFAGRRGAEGPAGAPGALGFYRGQDAPVPQVKLFGEAACIRGRGRDQIRIQVGDLAVGGHLPFGVLFQRLRQELQRLPFGRGPFRLAFPAG